MYFIWLLLSVFCMAYYLIGAGYAGFGSAFLPVWLFASIFFLAIFVIFRFIKVNEVEVHPVIRYSFWTVFFAGLGLFVILEGLIISRMTSVPKNECEYVIILGAQIKGYTPSKALKDRLDTAYDYIVTDPDIKIIVSGGQGSNEVTSEARVMKDYLVSKGIASERIIMEDKSKNTAENLKYSAELIEDRTASVGIVSSNFHIYRATKLAAAQGLTNVSGLASPCRSILFLNYIVRESIGITKDAVMGNY